MELDSLFLDVTPVPTPNPPIQEPSPAPIASSVSESPMKNSTTSVMEHDIQTVQPTTTTATTTTSGVKDENVTLLDEEMNPDNLILNLLMNDKITEVECNLLRNMCEENVGLKERISKLKNLLSRSANAQKETTQNLSKSKIQAKESEYMIQALKKKIEQLHNRPTHMDLLADFETNFDRAVLSLGGTSYDQQSGGENPSSTVQTTNVSSSQENMEEDSNVDIINNLKSRIEQLESMNSNFVTLKQNLQVDNLKLQQERDSAKSQLSNLELELRIAKMDTNKALFKIKENSISFAEMQMEINLVTKASAEVIAKSKETLEQANDVRVSKRHVEELQAKVDALQEWALASAEAKRITCEHAKQLEAKLEELQPQEQSPKLNAQRKLWTESISKVIGAGMTMQHTLELKEIPIEEKEVVVVRWKFDVIPTDMDIDFWIVKGKFKEGKKLEPRDYLIEPRTVFGGAGGELMGAFSIQSACTLQWSNKKSWVRPRAIKFTMDAFAIQE